MREYASSSSVHGKPAGGKSQQTGGHPAGHLQQQDLADHPLQGHIGGHQQYDGEGAVL